MQLLTALLTTRLTRTTYFGLVVIVGCAVSLIELAVDYQVHWWRSADLFRLLANAPGWMVALELSGMAAIVVLIAARLRDMNFSPWWALLFPVVRVAAGAPALWGAVLALFGVGAWYALFCWPGTLGANRFGPDPREARATRRRALQLEQPGSAR
jgi:uncharacterized membrane protein YhaH (DUF805 family)